MRHCGGQQTKLRDRQLVASRGRCRRSPYAWRGSPRPAARERDSILPISGKAIGEIVMSDYGDAMSDRVQRFREAALPCLDDAYRLAYFLLQDRADAANAVQKC